MRELSDSLLVKRLVVLELFFELLDGFVHKVVHSGVFDEEGIFDVFHEDFIVVLGPVPVLLILVVGSRVKLS
jgi:hypothetical protein